MTTSCPHDRSFGLLALKHQQESMADEAESESQIQAAYAKIHERMLRLAGDHSAAMLESPEAAYRCLAHRDAGVREAALYFVCDHWNQARDYEEAIIRLSSDDPDSKVREAAIGKIGSLYNRSRNTEIAQLLAQFVADDQQPVTLRQKAYFSLRCVMRMHPFPNRISQLYAKVPEEVDWNLVHACIRQEAFVVPDEDLPIPERIERMMPPETAVAMRFFSHAEEAFDAGRYEEATHSYSEGLSHAPHAAGALHSRGCAHGNLGNLDAAIADFTAAIELTSSEPIYRERPEFYLERAEAYRRKGLLDLMKADIQKAGEIEQRLKDGPAPTG
jgi:tetratricopeptide (TPR) repeat protein